jgi:ankyrin repeat protein
VTKLILEYGAEINVRGTDGIIELAYAVMRSYEEMVVVLIRVGVDVNAANPTDQMPLHWAVFNRHEGILREVLQRSDIELSSRNKDGKITIQVALEKSCEELVRLLQERASLDEGPFDVVHPTPVIVPSNL